MFTMGTLVYKQITATFTIHGLPCSVVPPGAFLNFNLLFSLSSILHNSPFIWAPLHHHKNYKVTNNYMTNGVPYKWPIRALITAFAWLQDDYKRPKRGQQKYVDKHGLCLT